MKGDYLVIVMLLIVASTTITAYATGESITSGQPSGIEFSPDGGSKILCVFNTPESEWYVIGGPGSFVSGNPYGHCGDDYYANDWVRHDKKQEGQPVYAAISGIVYMFNIPTAWGKEVIIYDPNSKFALRYAHLNDYDESLSGKWISATSDTPLGHVGRTGPYNTGPHLHLVLYKNVNSIDKGNPVSVSSCSVQKNACVKGPTEYAAKYSFVPRSDESVGTCQWCCQEGEMMGLRKSGNLPKLTQEQEAEIVSRCKQAGCIDSYNQALTTGTCVSSTNQRPNVPASNQYKLDGNSIPVAAQIIDRDVAFKSKVSNNNGIKVRLEVELRRLDEYGGQFDDSKGGLKESDYVDSGNEATAYAHGLINGYYHWRARAIDKESGLASDWEDFGNNQGADFIVFSNTGTGFNKGDRVRTTSGNKLNVRTDPGTKSPSIGTIVKGGMGTVINGPVFADNLNWWKIEYDAGITGWSSGKWLELAPQAQVGCHEDPTTGQVICYDDASVFSKNTPVPLISNDEVSNQPQVGQQGPVPLINPGPYPA